MDEWKLEPARDLGLPLRERALSPCRESGLVESALHLGWWLVLRAYFRVWHRLEIRGCENLPAEPSFACAANHASHLDALALACAFPASWRDSIFPIAAGDTFFDTPAVAAFAAFVLNALPMWRRNCGVHGLQALRERLTAGTCVYLIFPEGTRTREGRPGGFKPGLGMLVAGTGVPVVPCHLTGTFEALPAGRKLPRPRKIILRIGKPLHFPTVNNDRAGWREISAVTEAAVTALRRP